MGLGDPLVPSVLFLLDWFLRMWSHQEDLASEMDLGKGSSKYISGLVGPLQGKFRPGLVNL